MIQPKLRDYYNNSNFDYAGAAGGFLDKYGYPYCNGRIYNKVEIDNNQYDDKVEIFWACGACYFIRNDIFKKFGGFDDLYWAHFEEIDLCWRLQNHGFKIRLNSKSIVYHANGGTLGHNNPNKTYLNFRNMLFTITKNSKMEILITRNTKTFFNERKYYCFSSG